MLTNKVKQAVDLETIVVKASLYQRHIVAISPWRFSGSRHGDATAPACMASAIVPWRPRGADLASCGAFVRCGGRSRR